MLAEVQIASSNLPEPIFTASEVQITSSNLPQSK